jgi:glycosyltransferase involved in cell wall biosynthesis
MENKKRIIISSYDDVKNPYYGGGGAVAVNKLANFLSKNYEVLLITGKYRGSKNEIIEGVKYKRIGSDIFGGKIGHLFYLITLPFESLKEKCDLWIDSFTPPFSFSLVPLIKGKNGVVALVHMLSGKDMRRKYKIPFDVVERFGLKLYKYFVVLTDSSKKEILKANPRAKVFIIPNGIDMENRKDLSVKKRHQILFMGRVEVNQKGLDLLLSAYKKIIKKIDWDLVIAGGGAANELEHLVSLIETNNLNGMVKLTGHVSGKTKTKLLKESSIVVIPSRFETLSLTALEALAAKTVLCTFDIEGFKWLPQKFTLKAMKFDVEDMASKIVSIVGDSVRMKKYEEDGYKFVQKYSWTNIFLKYESVLKNLIK